MRQPYEWSPHVGNPGSGRAQRFGCSCSPVLNYFGRGDESGLYKIAPDCPAHAQHQVPIDGIRCRRCGAELEVVGRKRLRTVCPNGCSPAEIDHPTAGAARI